MSSLTPFEVAQRALASLDLTDLADACPPDAAMRLVARATTPYGHVAAICVWPHFVSQARERLHQSPIRIATVINFPAGDEDIERAVEDSREALRDGADEIDLVIPWRAILRGDTKLASDMIGAIAEMLTGGRQLKVILETGCLETPEAIDLASRIAIEAGAHFIKTSTGKTSVSATPQAARIMLNAIRASGRAVGFKASGGLRSLDDAKVYLDLADEIMGEGWASPSTFRFGASGLLDPVLATLAQGSATA